MVITNRQRQYNTNSSWFDDRGEGFMRALFSLQAKEGSGYFK